MLSRIHTCFDWVCNLLGFLSALMMGQNWIVYSSPEFPTARIWLGLFRSMIESCVPIITRSPIKKSSGECWAICFTYFAKVERIKIFSNRIDTSKLIGSEIHFDGDFHDSYVICSKRKLDQRIIQMDLGITVGAIGVKFVDYCPTETRKFDIPVGAFKEREGIVSILLGTCVRVFDYIYKVFFCSSQIAYKVHNWQNASSDMKRSETATR